VRNGVALVTYGSEMLDRVDRLLVYFLFVTGHSPIIPVGESYSILPFLTLPPLWVCFEM